MKSQRTKGRVIMDYIAQLKYPGFARVLRFSGFNNESIFYRVNENHPLVLALISRETLDQTEYL